MAAQNVFVMTAIQIAKTTLQFQKQFLNTAFSFFPFSSFFCNSILTILISLITRKFGHKSFICFPNDLEFNKNTIFQFYFEAVHGWQKWDKAEFIITIDNTQHQAIY